MDGQVFFVKVKGDDRYRPVYTVDEVDARLYAEFRFEWRMRIDKMLRQIPNVVDLHAVFVKQYISS